MITRKSFSFESSSLRQDGLEVMVATIVWKTYQCESDRYNLFRVKQEAFKLVEVLNRQPALREASSLQFRKVLLVAPTTDMFPRVLEREDFYIQG